MTTESSVNPAAATLVDYSTPQRVDAASAARSTAGGPLALGFAITVAVWTVAYICRMPMVQLSAPLTISLMLATILVGGFFAGRHLAKPLTGAALAGAISGLLDILMIGAIFSQIRTTHPEFATGAAVALWFTASIALNALLTTFGALAGRATRSANTRILNAKALLAWTLPVATLPLITAGGLVTAMGAGLAVPDWPNSFGYNMFLLPLSQMQGGTFYEHSHRLMGTLVGLVSLTLAVYLSVVDRRNWVKSFAWVIFVSVCIQGLLGGLRVTGKLTTSTDPAAMTPSTTLAIIHGVFAQLVFGLMAALATACSRTWQSDKPAIRTPTAQTDFVFSAALVLFMVAQLILGALLRHRDLFVIAHITNSVLVTALAITCGVRAWGLYETAKPLQLAGLAVVIVVFCQLLFGVLALVLRSPLAANPTSSHAISTTLHQANGALLMAACLTLFFWTLRFARFPERAAATPHI